MCQRMTQDTLRSAITAAPERLYVDWVALGDTGIEVTAQPVRIDGDDGPIVPVDARTAQRMADMLDAYPTCAEIDDLIWTLADIRLDPHCMPNDGSWDQAMLWDAWCQDQLRQRRIGSGTLCAVGDKTWVIRDTEVHGKVPNYGFHVPTVDCSMGGTWHGVHAYPTVTRTAARVLQSVAYAHNACHADYSQHCRLWRWADGRERAIDWLPKARRLPV